MKRNKLLLLFSLFLAGTSFAQIQDYGYQRRIEGIRDGWHSLKLPDSLFAKLNSNLSDLRVFGITENKDTIEAPYILRELRSIKENREIEFNLINTSHRNSDYYFTLEIPSEQTINHLSLNFKQHNFDWLAVLEGSMDQKEWLQIDEPFRLVSIQNEEVQFSYTTLKFAPIKYRYLRIHINSKVLPELVSAHLLEENYTQGSSKIYPIKDWSQKNLESTKQTKLLVDLGMKVPISAVQLFVHDSFDYYRPITISYLTLTQHKAGSDSMNYRMLYRSFLHSMDGPPIEFPSLFTQHLKILIDNENDQALLIDSIQVTSPEYEMQIRFTQEATYYLCYGNAQSVKASYDIQRFSDKIPENLSELSLGEEAIIHQKSKVQTSPLFENKGWLYLIMAAIIAVLGWFTFRMMKRV